MLIRSKKDLYAHLIMIVIFIIAIIITYVYEKITKRGE